MFNCFSSEPSTNGHPHVFMCAQDYFLSRKNLVMVFQLVDSTIPPQQVDLDYSAWLSDNQVPFAIVFTKTDKRRKGSSKSKTAKESNMTAFKRALLQVRMCMYGWSMYDLYTRVGPGCPASLIKSATVLTDALQREDMKTEA